MFSAQVQYTVAGVLLRGMCPSQQVCLFFFSSVVWLRRNHHLEKGLLPAKTWNVF